MKATIKNPRYRFIVLLVSSGLLCILLLLSALFVDNNKYLTLAFLLLCLPVVVYFYYRIAALTDAIINASLMREEHLRETLNSLDEGVITCDVDGIIQGMNPAAAMLTGWDIDTVQGKSLEDIYNVVNELTGKPFENIVSRILREGRTIEFENNTILYSKNRQSIVISNSGTPLKDSAGNIVGAVLVFRDMTERKKLNEARIALTNRLLLATKSAGMGIWEWDIATNLLTWDDGIRSIYQIEAPIYHCDFDDWIGLIHPQDRAGITLDIQDALAGKREYVTEFRIMLPDNALHYIRSTGTVEFNEAGKPVRIIGANWDISQRKSSEIKLAKSEAFNSGVLRSLSSHIAVIDAMGTIVASNDAWNEFALANGKDTLEGTGPGSNYFEVCERAISSGDKNAAEPLAGMKAVLNGELEGFNYEYECTGSKPRRWFRMRVKRFQNDASMIVVSHENVTAVKLAQQEREAVTNDLMLRNKNMEQFSYIVSHNLRAPVANIMGATELLQMDGLSRDEEQTLIKDLSLAAKNLDDVIIDLNNILQVKYTENVLSELVSFSKTVSDVEFSIRHLTKIEGLTIVTDFSEVDLMLTLKSYIYSIFFNLISNSIKFRQPGREARIEISSAIRNNKILISYSDNGLGMDLTKYGPFVFGLYKRFHTHVEGKGMGLYMVKTHVESLGGKISVQSEVNHGTDFLLEF